MSNSDSTNWYSDWQCLKRFSRSKEKHPGIIFECAGNTISILSLNTLETWHYQCQEADHLMYTYNKVRNEYGDPSVVFLDQVANRLYLQYKKHYNLDIYDSAYISPTDFIDRSNLYELNSGSTWNTYRVTQIERAITTLEIDK